MGQTRLLYNRLIVGVTIMKPTFGIIIILSILTLVGCGTTPSTDFAEARKINSIDSYRSYLQKHPHSQYTNRAKTEITKLEKSEIRKNQIKRNWGELSKGMSVDEVDSFIGPLNRGAVMSIKNLSKNKNASNGFPYRGHYFTIIFDATGRLSEWSLK